MIYQPVNAEPSNIAIDALTDNTFTWTFSGDMLSKYKLEIYLLNTETVSYTQEVTPSNTIYGGDRVSVVVPANSLTNGNEYIWKVTQYEQSPTMFVINGKVVSATSTTDMVISTQMSSVMVGMFLDINGEQHEIVEYNSTDGKLKVKDGFITQPTGGTLYSIYTPFTTSLNGYYIKTRQTPTISINPLPSSVLDTDGRLIYRSATFTATYTQAQNVSIKYHNWTLYNNHTNAILNQTQDVYNSNLSFKFDGFVSGNTYKVVINIETQENQFVSAEYVFTVYYNAPELLDTPTAEWNPEHNSVKIDCQIIKVSSPTIDGAYEINPTDNFLHIKNGTISYNTISDLRMNFNDYTILTEVYLDENYVKNIIGAYSDDGGFDYISVDSLIEDNVPIGRYFQNTYYNNGNIAIDKIKPLKNGIAPMLSDTPTIDEDIEYVWNDAMIWDFDTQTQVFVFNTQSVFADNIYKIAIMPNQVIMQDKFGTRYTVNTSRNNMILNDIRLYANVYYKYLIVTKNILSDDDLDTFFATNFAPQWGIFNKTVLIANFSESLISSNLSSLMTSEIKSVYIYRLRHGDSVLKNIGQIALTQSYIEDLSLANGETYTWYIVPVSDTELGSAIQTNSITVVFDEWTVQPLILDTDENYFTTNETWKFGINVQAQQLTQNILKTKFEGLSRYPKYTIEQRNYISGGLTAYLSNITINDIDDTSVYPDYHMYNQRTEIYYEPAEKLEKWNDLVASGIEVLIRDLKGHMYRAQIDSNTAEINIFNQVMPTEINFTFTEVGSVDDISCYIKGAMVHGI